MIVISVRRTQTLVMRDGEMDDVTIWKTSKVQYLMETEVEAIARTKLLRSYGKWLGKMTGGHR